MRLKDMIDRHMADEIDRLDASVFSGDALEKRGAREYLRTYLRRWERALDERADAEVFK